MDRRPSTFALPLAVCLATAPAMAQSSAPPASASQPSVPRPVPPAANKPGSPVVEQIVHEGPRVLVVRKQAARPVRRHRVLVRRHVPRDLDRPALAGVELLAPLPLPGEPPHLTVPMPAYPLDSLATAWTTPPPPIVCHRTQRDPDAPDPHLYREVPVDCEPDNP